MAMQGGEEGADLPPPAQAVLKAFSTLISAPRTKNDAKDFEKLLVQCDSGETAALVQCDELWRLLKQALPQYETHWDVMGLLLNRVSLEPEGRHEALEQGFTALLGDALAVKGKVARGDKQVERLGSMSCILALLSVDAPEDKIAPWCTKLCASVKEALEKSRAKGSIMEAYSLLTVFIKLLYTSTGTRLAAFTATTFVNSTQGGVGLLFRVAKKGLLEAELTGAPKIVAEKSLVILAKLNADAPQTRFVPNQLDPLDLGNFLVKCARDCSWVQSQDIAMTFLARLIFQQRQIAVDFLAKPEVIDMLRHVLSHKSTALKITGVAFISMCPAAVFYQLAAEFEQAINGLADSPARTLKMVIWEAGRGIWGIPCPLSPPASHALQNSEFLHHAADSVPAVIPKCLWQLLPADLQRHVAASQGIEVNVGEEQHMEDDMLLSNEADDGNGEHAHGMDVDTYSPPDQGAATPRATPEMNGSAAAAGSGPSAPAQIATSSLQPGPSWRAAPQAEPAASDGSGAGGSAVQQEDVKPGGPSSRNAGIEVSNLEPEVRRVLTEEGMLAKPSPTNRPKPTIRIKRSVVDAVQAVLALQQLHEGNRYADETDNAAQGLQELEKQPQPSASKRRHSTLGSSRQVSAGGAAAGAAATPEPADEEDTSTASLASKRQRQKRAGSHAQLAAEQVRAPAVVPPPLPRSGAIVPAAPAQPSTSGGEPEFGTEDVRALNQLLDSMYEKRHSMGPRGQALIKNMAEGAANISTVVYLRTYHLPPAATAGLDQRLATLKARAHLVHNGVMGSEPLDLLLPFSELLSAESGIIRRYMEAHAKSAGVPATSTEGTAQVYSGGENVRYSLY